jgi:hypothetical protein
VPSPASTFDQLVVNPLLGGLQELASGVDALYLSARVALPAIFVARLEDTRLWANELRRSAPHQIGELWFGVAPHGWGKYRAIGRSAPAVRRGRRVAFRARRRARVERATEVERRVLIDEFLEEILVLPDYLDVTVHGAPPLHVR